MHGSFDRRETGNSIYRNWGIGFLALPAVIVVALVGLAMNQPATSNWISEAVQAEFVGTDPVLDVAPTRLARPATEIRTVRAN